MFAKLFHRIKLPLDQNEEQWEIPVSNWKSLTTETLLFIHNEASKKLNSSIEIYHSITGRGVVLLSIYTSIYGVAFGFVISKIGQQLETSDKVILGVALFALVVSFYAFRQLYNLIIPQKYYDIGNPPDRFDYSVIESIENQSDQYRLIVYNQIQALQNHIISNEEINRMRWSWYKKALNCTSWSLICCTIVLILLHLIFA